MTDPRVLLFKSGPSTQAAGLSTALSEWAARVEKNAKEAEDD